MKHLIAISALLASTLASAAEIPTGGTPVRLSVTNTTVAAWHGSNGNTTSCDDNLGAGVEKLNVNGSWSGWNAGLRIDGSGFLATPQATDVNVTVPTPCGSNELGNRYTARLIPEKLWLGWAGQNVEVTLGDSYVSFGRGMTLSMRKTDEFGLDTTQQGLRVRVTTDRFSGTVVTGVSNINNLDEPSGRHQDDSNDGILGASGDVRVVGNVRVGANASAFIFHDPKGPAPLGVDNSYRERWVMAGPKIDAPGITDWLSVYLEGVGQRRMTADGSVSQGFGMYGSATVNMGSVTALIEGKNYGDLEVVHPKLSYLDTDPVLATTSLKENKDFDAVTYNAMPTLERISQVLKHPQQNVSGGRIRLDWTIDPNLSVFVNEGLFKDTYEGGYIDMASPTFETLPGIINDPYAGLDARLGEQRVHVEAGYRWVALRGAENALEDAHLDLDVVRAFEGGHTVEMHLIHLERVDRTGFAPAFWREGTLQMSYRMRPRFAVSGILDYTTQELGQDSIWYPGATGEYDFTESSNFKLFAGSMRGGLKCVAGICKQFPAFSGVKGTLTLRY